MGRGLSELQKEVLRIGLHNREARGPGNVDVMRSEALQQVFGWELLYPWTRLRRDDGRPSHGQHFSKQRIGVAHYQSAQASVTRALRRLERRGLVIRCAHSRYVDVDLTESGIKRAREVENEREKGAN